MTKGARGSVILDVNGKECRVLYTNRALAEIEANLNKSVIEIAEGLSSGKTGIRDVASMLRAGMEASRRDLREGGRSVTIDDAYKVLDEIGFADAITVLVPAIVEMLTPMRDDEDEEDPN